MFTFKILSTARLFICIFIFIYFMPCFGQSQTMSSQNGMRVSKGILNGTLKDSITHNVVDFATVTLILTNRKPVSGTLSKKDGTFQFNDVPNGTYLIAINVIGYQTYTTRVLSVKQTNEPVNIGTIYLQPSLKELNEVSVKAFRPVIKVEADKITYSVESDITNRGLSALDALNKAPLISIGGNDQVTLKGSTNFKVYVNGKSSSLYTGRLSEILRVMPAESIKEIEIITNPSAKYDAEGTGGIINIITFKKGPTGYNGLIFGSINHIGIYNAGGQLAANYGRLNASITISNGDYRRPQNIIETSQENYTNTGISHLYQNQENEFKSNYLSGSIDLNYSIDTLNIVSGSFLLYNGRNTTNGNLQSQYFAESGVLDNSFERFIYRRTHYLTTETNIGYLHNFKHPKQYLSFNYKLNHDQPEISYHTIQKPVTNSSDFAGSNTNNEVNQESTFQVDYSQPMKSNQLVEIGAKDIIRDLKSNYLDYQGINDNQLILNPSATGQLKYKQNIVSGYALYSLAIKNYSLKFGTRLEHTNIDATIVGQNIQIYQSYLSFIPTLSTSFTLPNKNLIRFSYSRRIQRPSLFYLNPYINQLNPLSISYGNPNLRPEYVNSLELGYNLSKNKSQFNFTLYYQNTSRSIQAYKFLQQDSILVNTYDNFGHQTNVGLNIYASTSAIKRLPLSGNVTVGYYHAQFNEINTSKYIEGLNVKGSINTSYKFSNTLTGLINVSYNSPAISFQTKTHQYFYSSLGLTKDILKGKGSITLNVSQPFYKISTYKYDYNTSDFDQAMINRYQERFFKLNFRYKFGKITNSRNIKKIKNDDLKDSN